MGPLFGCILLQGAWEVNLPWLGNKAREPASVTADNRGGVRIDPVGEMNSRGAEETQRDSGGPAG